MASGEECIVSGEEDEEELLDELLDSALDEFDVKAVAQSMKGESDHGGVRIEQHSYGHGDEYASPVPGENTAKGLSASEQHDRSSDASASAFAPAPSNGNLDSSENMDPLLQALAALNTANAASAVHGGADVDDGDENEMMKELLAALSKSMNQQGQGEDDGEGSGDDGMQMQALLAELLKGNSGDRDLGNRERAHPAASSSSAPQAAAHSSAPKVSQSSNPDQFEALVEGLMEQILSKDLMKAPMTHVKEQYDAFLASEAAATLPAGERERYEKQARCMTEVVETYETGSDLGRVQELLEKMQEFGDPPPSIAAEIEASRTRDSGNMDENENGEDVDLDQLEKFADQCKTQ